MTVSVDADLHFGVLPFHRFRYRYRIGETVGGLTVAAEDQLGVFIKVAGEYRVHNLIEGGLALKPEAVGAISAVTVIANAEIATVGAFIGHIYVETAVYYVGYTH
jgi:hypothetical protein